MRLSGRRRLFTLGLCRRRALVLIAFQQREQVVEDVTDRFHEFVQQLIAITPQPV